MIKFKEDMTEQELLEAPMKGDFYKLIDYWDIFVECDGMVEYSSELDEHSSFTATVNNQVPIRTGIYISKETTAEEIIHWLQTECRITWQTVIKQKLPYLSPDFNGYEMEWSDDSFGEICYEGIYNPLTRKIRYPEDGEETNLHVYVGCLVKDV